MGYDIYLSLENMPSVYHVTCVPWIMRGVDPGGVLCPSKSSVVMMERSIRAGILTEMERFAMIPLSLTFK